MVLVKKIVGHEGYFFHLELLYVEINGMESPRQILKICDFKPVSGPDQEQFAAFHSKTTPSILDAMWE